MWFGTSDHDARCVHTLSLNLVDDVAEPSTIIQTGSFGLHASTFLCDGPQKVREQRDGGAREVCLEYGIVNVEKVGLRCVTTLSAYIEGGLILSCSFLKLEIG